MRALVYTASQTIEARDVPLPEPRSGEVLVKIEAVGICGSDMHAWAGHDERRPAPLILGHEAAGIALDGQYKNQRVAINPLVTCGQCEACREGRENLCPQRQIISMPPREGAFAEYVSMPEENLVLVPKHVSALQAALTEPLACGWHAVALAHKELHKPIEYTSAVVLGGGAIGFGAALSLKAWGCQDITIIEPNEDRLNFIQNVSDFIAVSSPDEIKNAPNLVIDGVGFQTSRVTATKIIKPGGVIIHIGLGHSEGGLDIRRMTLQEVTFTGSYTYTKQDFKDTAHALFEGKLGALDWAETRALENGASAFEDIAASCVASPKIILTI